MLLRRLRFFFNSTHYHRRHVTTTATSPEVPLPLYHYNTVIKSLSRKTHSSKQAILLFNHLRAISGLKPDTYTLPPLLKAVSRLSDIRVGTQIHCQSITLGLHKDVHVSTALIQMYSHCENGSVINPRKVFDEMTVRETASWNAVISACAKASDVDAASDLFEEMPEHARDIISWTCLIAGYTHAKRPREAIWVFCKLQVAGVDPDEVAMVSVLSACAQLGALELGEWVHRYIDERNLRSGLPINNALIDMYSKSGNMRKALQVFESMKERCVRTWTTIIGGLASHGLGREALEMFTCMERAQIKPNEITFVAVLSACSHIGLVEVGRWFFTFMESKYGIRPNIKHYGCMIDLLGRCGCLKEAKELVNKMPFQANAAIWGSLLAASRIHDDVALAECSLQHLIVLEPENSGNYMHLSNIYAAHSRWDESRVTRKLMEDAGVRKVPGVSSIEVNNKLHEFCSGDKSHPHFEKISKVFSQMAEQLMLSSDMCEEQFVLIESKDS